MNYLNIYHRLVKNRQENLLSTSEYGENHHIIPVCMGGSNEDVNIVRLTAKEHYVAHHLLWRQYKTSKLAHAWFCMMRQSDNQNRTFSANQYEKCRLAHVDAMKETMVGEGNHFYGHKHSEESLQKMRDKKIGKKLSPETKLKMSIARKGIPKSEDHKIKIGRKGLVMLKNFSTGESIRISKEESINFDPTIWKNPSTQQEKISCIHCGVKSNGGNIKRWHNENCKNKISP